MVSNTMSNRVKAAGIAAVLCLSAAAACIPAMTASMDVSAAAVEINEHIGVKETYTGYTADLASSGIKTITFTCKSDYTGNFSYGFGINTSVAPDYWVEVTEGEVAVEEGVEFDVTIDVSAYELGYNPSSSEWASHYEFRDYYSGDDGWIYILSAEANKGSDPVTNPTDDVTKPTNPVNPGEGPKTDGSVSVNKTSGTWKFTDNKDGTGTMEVTQARQMDVDYLLTTGYDEEYYEELGQTPVEGTDPLNSHKFEYGSFGLSGIGSSATGLVKDVDYITIESLQATITSDVALKRFMYGGGLNVQPESPADTESDKVAAGMKETGGYWYNDMGEDVLKECAEAGVAFDITPGMGYDLTASEGAPLGEYFNVIWDVPEEVKPYEDHGSVSFQFWYGEQDAEEYTPAETVNLVGGIITYTETKMFDYTNHVSAEVGTELAAGDMGGVKLSDLELGATDTVQAVVFTVSAGSDLDKLVYGVGASVGEDWKQWPDTEGGDAWNYCITNTKQGDVEIAWIVPDGVDINEEYGEVKFGYWWGGQGETELNAVTLKSVDVYYSEAAEVPTEEPTEKPTEEPTEKPTEEPTEEPTEKPTEEPKKVVYGDVNESGSVEIGDVIMLCKAAMGAATLTDQGALNGDVDLSGKADATDASYILQNIVKLVELPVKA